jgi:hypothetical protein
MKPTLQRRQQQLMAHLLAGDSAIDEHIAQQGTVSTATRLHIYRNAYQSRLRETVDTDFPITGSYLGDDLFEKMVGAYREAHLSKHRSLRCYGDALPKFLATQKPFCDNPEIAELARIERMLLSAFDAAEGVRIGSGELQQVPIEAWPTMTVRFHASVHLFASEWNVVSLWQALKSENTPPAADTGFEAWLLWRNADLLTEFKHLQAVEHCLFTHFQSGADFASSCEALLEYIPADAVSVAVAKTLLEWMESGLIVELIHDAEISRDE